MHLSALKDLRSTFELGAKDINTLGKAIFLGRVGIDKRLVEHARSYATIFTIRSIQLTIITKPNAERVVRRRPYIISSIESHRDGTKRALIINHDIVFTRKHVQVCIAM